MENPLVSVIISTYNGQARLKKAIDSVLQQVYVYMEIIIIDDGSRDGTAAVVSQLAASDKRISLIYQKENKGFVQSLNAGLQRAKGKYVARIDDDDTWADPEKLAKQVMFLENHPGYVLVGGGLIKVDGTGREVVRYLFPMEDQEIRKAILVANCFAHSAVCFLRQAALAVGGYDERFGFFADRDLWLKLGAQGKFYNFPEYFACYLDKEIDGKNYKARDLQIRRKLLANLQLRWKFKDQYPGFYQAALLCLFSFTYSFVPYKNKLWPLMFKLRVAVFGKPSYTYYQKNEKGK